MLGRGLRRCLVVLVLVTTFSMCSSTHITGRFNPGREFFKFLVKFGFQKTERNSLRDTYGYIYGNITATGYLPVNLTFAVLDGNRFLDFYGNHTIPNREIACQRMFSQLDSLAYSSDCNPEAKGDYLRQVPCPVGALCPDEDTPANVVHGSQFTYVISDLFQARFWYVSLVACYRNTTTCEWHHFEPSRFNLASVPDIQYDFRLVNGNPNQSAFVPLAFHFSFDQQYTFEMYLIFILVYTVLVPLQFYAMRRQRHPVTRLFTISITMEFISLCLILVHMIKFAMNGEGNENFRFTGDIFDIFSRTSFMLILLLLSKGWAVTRQEISRTGWIILMSIWIPYCAFNVLLYVWNTTEVDIVSDESEFQTWPGRILLMCRSMIMLWFLWELRNTMKYEHSTKKLDFLLHFGASSLVWFIYLPIFALVVNQVSPLWRYKLQLGITNSADCLGYIVMMGLLWPNRAGQSVLLAGPKYSGMDELEEFSEAPHVVNNCSISSSGQSTASNGHQQPNGVSPAAALVKVNGEVGGNFNRKNHQNSNRNGYTEKTIGRRNGGVNLMDDLVGVSSDDEDDSEEIVINEFRRPGSATTRSHNNKNITEMKMMNGGGGVGKVTLNGGDFGDDDDDEVDNEDNDEYEHISLSDDGLAKHNGHAAVVLGSDISTDLLNCDDNDSDLLILTNGKEAIHHHSQQQQQRREKTNGSYRMFVNS